MGKKSKTLALRRSERENNNLDPSVPRLPPKPKLEEYVNQGSNDLFEGALAKAAMAALSDEAFSACVKSATSLAKTLNTSVQEIEAELESELV